MGVADGLLGEISAMGNLSPVRDDRGVVVTLPAPLHTFLRQSPALCTLVTVPCGVTATPQTPAHVRWLHTVSCPGH